MKIHSKEPQPILVYLVKIRKSIMKIVCFNQYALVKKILKKQEVDLNYYEFKEKLLSKIIRLAKKRSAFYKSINSENIKELPIVTKDLMRKNFSLFINKRVLSYNRFKSNTGGSTGEPFGFYTNRLSGYIDAGHQKAFMKRIGYERGEKMFTFDGTVIAEDLQRQNIYWIETGCDDNVFGSRSYSTLCLTTKNIPFVLESINKAKPAFLRGYPSALTTIAEYMQKNNYLLTFQIKGIVLTAETILDWQVDLFRNIFDASVYGQYGHTEKCVCAYTEANSLSYVCSPYYGHVEILNDENCHVQIGEIGKIIVTSYYNAAMFFIRYDTGDLAEYGGKDDKGAVKLTQIVGRTQDFLIDGTGNKVNITAMVFGYHFEAFRHIVKWQIEQGEYGKVKIHIIKDVDYGDKDELEIKNKFHELMFDVEFCYTDSIPLSPRGKYRFIQQNLKV